MKKNNNWFEFAKEDLVVARASLKEEVYNQVCFHTHQGVEKMLKGYLTVKEKDVPRIHSIGRLVGLLPAGCLWEYLHCHTCEACPRESGEQVSTVWIPVCTGMTRGGRRKTEDGRK